MESLQIGSIISNKNIQAPFRVLEHRPTFYSPDTYVLQNVFTGWTILAHKLTRYEDGSYEWDFSTEGRFEHVGK